MDFPFLNLQHLLEDNPLTPLLFPVTTLRPAASRTSSLHLQVASSHALVNPHLSMPYPPFLLVEAPAHGTNNLRAQFVPQSHATDRPGPARTDFGLGLLPQARALPPSPPRRRTPPVPQARLPPVDRPPSQHPTLPPHLTIARATRLPQPERDPPFREPNSDDFLNELVSRHFSSPSLSPQRPRASPPPSPGLQLSGQANASSSGPINHCATGPGDLAARHDTSCCPSHPTETLAPREAMSSGPRRASRGAVPLPDLELELTEARSTRSRQGRAAQPRSSPQHPPSLKRKRGLTTEAPDDSKETIALDSDDSPFSDDKNQNLEIVDLADTDDVPDLAGLASKKHQVQLRGLQCVICMDDTTNLTVTHCGHLFCGECLHSSLQIDSTKKICPICRQKIDIAARAKAKTFYPLRMKLMTAKRHGKKVTR